MLATPIVVTMAFVVVDREPGGAEAAAVPPASVTTTSLHDAPLRTLRGDAPVGVVSPSVPTTAVAPTSSSTSTAPVSAGLAAPTTVAPTAKAAAPAPIPVLAAPSLAGPAVVPESSGGWTRRPDLEEQVLAMHNATRAQYGVGALAMDPCHRSTAVRWARGMADRNSLQHNPSYAAETMPCSSDRYYGENVGVGFVEAGGVGGVFDAFMASGDHRPNIVDTRFQRVGIGVWSSDDGTFWVAVDFGAPTS